MNDSLITFLEGSSFLHTQSINPIEFKAPPSDRVRESESLKIIFCKKLLKSFGGFCSQFLICFANDFFFVFLIFLFVSVWFPRKCRKGNRKERNKTSNPGTLIPF